MTLNRAEYGSQQSIQLIGCQNLSSRFAVKICCQDLLSRLVVNIINIVNIFNMVNLTNIMISIPAHGLLNLCQIFFKSLSNLCQTFLDALASLGSMLESQSVTQSFMFLRFCQILGILQTSFRHPSDILQTSFRHP